MPYQAACIGLLQAVTTLGVESISILVIVAADTTQDIVFNFIALAIIADFDNFVYAALRGDPLKELLSGDNRNELLKVSFTTSKKAKSGE